MGRPKPPKYKEKKDGRAKLTDPIQAIGRKDLRGGIISPSQLDINIETQVPQEMVCQVRICPRKNDYVVEVVYEVDAVAETETSRFIAGVDNLAAVTSNKPGFIPILINGRPLKSTNQ